VCRMAGWATPAWAAQEAGRQKTELSQLKQEVARLRREGEQEAQTIAEMKREAELAQGLSGQNERLSKGLNAAEARIRELEDEKADLVAANREKETTAAREKAEAEMGVRKMEQERDENKRAFKMCLAALQTATRKLKGLQAQQAAAAQEKRATKEATCQTVESKDPPGNDREGREEKARGELSGRQTGPAGYLQLPGGRIPRAQGETAGRDPANHQKKDDGHHQAKEGPEKMANSRREGARGGSSPGPGRAQQDYWMKGHGTKRVKRDHRGVEKVAPSGGRQEQPRGPPEGPFRIRGGEAEPGRADRGAPADQAEEGRPRYRRGKKRGYRPPKGPGDGPNC